MSFSTPVIFDTFPIVFLITLSYEIILDDQNFNWNYFFYVILTYSKSILRLSSIDIPSSTINYTIILFYSFSSFILFVSFTSFPSLYIPYFLRTLQEHWII